MASNPPFSVTRDGRGQFGAGITGYPQRNTGDFAMGRPRGMYAPGGGFTFDTNAIGQIALVGVKQAVKTLNVRIGQTDHTSLQYLDALSPLFINKAITTRDYDVRGFVQAVTLGGLNHILRSAAGRRHFGRLCQGSRVSSEWIFWGVQQTDTSIESYEGRASFAMTTIIGYSALVPNYWLATGNKVGVGDHLWLLLRRRRYVTQSHSMFHTARRGSALAEIAHAPEEAKASENYWVWEPYKTPGTERPPRELLEGDGWIGEALYFGTVQKLYRMQNDPKRWQKVAKEVCFPANVDEEWRRKNQMLPRLTVMLGVK